MGDGGNPLRDRAKFEKQIPHNVRSIAAPASRASPVPQGIAANHGASYGHAIKNLTRGAAG